MATALRKEVIIGSVIALSLLGPGVFLLMNSLTPMEKKETVLSVTFTIARNSYENRTSWLKDRVDYRVYFTVSEGKIKFYPMSEAQLSVWLQGQFEPLWYESGQFSMGIGATGSSGGRSTVYFVFFNDDTFTKEVHLEVSNSWQEANFAGLLGGTALILSGGIAGIIIKSRLSRVHETTGS